MFGELPAVIEMYTLEKWEINLLRRCSGAMVIKAEQTADSLSGFGYKNGNGVSLH